MKIQGVCEDSGFSKSYFFPEQENWFGKLKTFKNSGKFSDVWAFKA